MFTFCENVSSCMLMTHILSCNTLMVPGITLVSNHHFYYNGCMHFTVCFNGMYLHFASKNNFVYKTLRNITRFLLSILFFFNYYLLFIYIFMAVLGLRFCARAFSSCGKRGPLFITVCGPLTIAASLVAEHRLQTRRLSSCGARA